MRMTSDQLIETLTNAAQSIRNRDSMEGNISYQFVTAKKGQDIFEVRGALRVGNSQGQGGVVLFNPVPIEEPDPSPSDSIDESESLPPWSMGEENVRG